MSGTPTDRGVASLGEFTFECGQSIPELQVAYETYGEFDGDNTVLICHALTGSQNVSRTPEPATGEDASDGSTGSDADQGQAGQARAWWDDVVGPGKAIDTTEYYVVCANVPGSCYGTSGPASERPEGLDLPDEPDHDRWGTAFPPVQVEDWTRAQRRLLDRLGVGRLRAVVGGSVGGMNALEWGKRYPDDVDRLVVIAAAARLDAQCLALDSIARRAIRADPNWNGGDYYGADRPAPETGLGIARQIGHVMYLSKASMERKFGRRSAGRDSLSREEGGLGLETDPAGTFFPYREVESYLDYQADGFADRFDPNSYLYLSRAMDVYDLAAGYSSDAAAVAAFEGETLLVSFTGDWHFTVEQSESLAGAFRDCDIPVAHHVIDSDHGHDAFLVEPERVGPPLRDFIADGVAGRAVTDGSGKGSSSQRDDAEHAPVHSSLFRG